MPDINQNHNKQMETYTDKPNSSAQYPNHIRV